jgi:hypothetical protein
MSIQKQVTAHVKRKLEVFVSSTFLDLQHERRAACEAILKLGHIPVGMELFAAGDKPPVEVIKKCIDDSDIYMLILGGRYGSIEPISGLGYTEFEYDYAVKAGKPTFSIVIDEAALERKVKKIGISAIERNNPAPLAGFRSKVLENISSFFLM